MNAVAFQNGPAQAYVVNTDKFTVRGGAIWSLSRGVIGAIAMDNELDGCGRSLKRCPVVQSGMCC
jgi:hypothetical protein